MASKDVELRVRAKDDASKNVKTISDALKVLRGEAQDAADGATKFGGALGSSSTEIRKLKSELDRIKVVGQLAAEFDRAKASVERTAGAVRGSTAEFARLARESEQASAASARFKAQVASEEAALQGRRRNRLAYSLPIPDSCF